MNAPTNDRSPSIRAYVIVGLLTALFAVGLSMGLIWLLG